MKKITMFFIATAMVAFVACSSGEKKSDETTIDDEEVTTTSSSNTGSDIVAQYEALCDKMVELSSKMKSGDMDAIQEYQKVAQDFANFAQKNQDAWSNLSEADAAKIQEIALKAANAIQ